MENVQIDIERIKKFPFRKFKKDFIYKKGRFIYKLSPESKEVMEAYDGFRGTMLEKKLALAEAFLYHKDIYAGYMMKYYRFLFKIQKCINDGRIRDAYAFFRELLDITATLRDNSILYWDFHSGNIKVTRNGHPFFLDLGDSVLNPTKSDEQHQKEFLAAFILNSYLDEFKTLSSYIVLLKGKDILSDKVITYLTSALDLNSGDLPLPYMLLEEINNEEVQSEIKKLIK